jgi:hypothetical protein
MLEVPYLTYTVTYAFCCQDDKYIRVFKKALWNVDPQVHCGPSHNCINNLLTKMTWLQ